MTFRDYMEMDYEQERAYGETRLPFWAWYAPRWITSHWLIFVNWLKWKYCQRHGHRIVDNGSYGGPDGGAEHLRCERCGWEWSHTMY